MTDVFISYSRKDIAFARLLYQSLGECDLDTWIDWERIPVGEKWWSEICEAIEKAHVFMFIISRNSVGSNVCRSEINEALKHNKRIIPIIVDNLGPEVIGSFVPDLNNINWILFERDHIFHIVENQDDPGDDSGNGLGGVLKEPQYLEALDKLIAAIHTDWEWVKYHTQLQVDALRWETNQRNTSYLIRGVALEEAEHIILRASGKDPLPTTLHAEFITASRQEETHRQRDQLQLEQKARQRQRVALWAVGIGLALTIVLGLFSWTQRNEAVRQSYIRATAEAAAVSESHSRATAEANAVSESHSRATAQVVAEAASTQAVAQKNEAVQQAAFALSSGLAAQSRNYIDSQYDLALLMAAESLNNADTHAARDGLFFALQAQPYLTGIQEIPSGYSHMGYSPDGSRMASISCVEADADNRCLMSQLQLWDTGAGQPLGEPFSQISGPFGFTSDSQSLIVHMETGSLATIDLQTQAMEILPVRIPEGFGDMAVSPDGALVATGGCGWKSFPSGICSNGHLELWSTTDGKDLFHTLDANLSDGGSISFSPNGMYLAWSGCDEISQNKFDVDRCTRGKVVVMDVATGGAAGYPIMGTTAAMSVAFSPDGKTLAAGFENGTIVFLDTQTWTENHKRLNEEKAVEQLFFLRDSLTLISSTTFSPIHIWNIQTSARLNELSITPGSYDLSAAALHSQSSTLAVSGCYQRDNTGFLCLQDAVLFWDASSHPPLARRLVELPPRKYKNQNYLSPDARFIALAECIQFEDAADIMSPCLQGRVTIIEPSKGEAVLSVINGFQSEIITAAINKTGDQLVTVSCNIPRAGAICEQSKIDLWDLKSGQSLRPSFLYNDWVLNITLAPDGNTLFFDGEDSMIERLNLETGLLDQQALNGFLLNTIAFSEDGKIMAAGGCTNFFQNCKESEIRIWDTMTWQMLVEPIQMTAADTQVSYMDIKDMEFNPSGSLLAIATQDGVYFWDVDSRQLAPKIIPQTNVRSIVFNRMGDTLAVYWKKGYASDYYVSLWDVGLMQPTGQPLGELGASRSFVFSQDDSQLVSDYGTVWDISPDLWQERACTIANRNLTQEEWNIFVGSLPYHKTCPDHP